MVTTLTVYLTVVVCLSAILRQVPAQPENDNGICGRMYIRNGPQELTRLENCRVIEGSLQIALANGSTDQWKNFSFPLREITGYLLLYDARGLQSLRHIFPNLTVIRGQEFIHNNYALLVNDMPDMQEIGLPSLTNILNGKVWIYNNQNLCYLDTIDWGKITNGTQGNGIKKNKQSSQCPNTCPTTKSCPISDNRPLCWSNEDCQKVQVKTCPEDCDGQNCEDCCSDQCLGGCSGPGPDNCFVCKHVEYNGLCMSSCPAGTFMYLNRRCVTEQECISVNFSDPTPGKFLSGKLLDNRECVLECPKGYEEINTGGVISCNKCRGHCKKICPGLMVDGVEASTQLKGCTRIQGSLKIQIRGYTPKLASQLEKNLDMIEEIDDYLVVAYTYSLLSLNFFRSLKTINGNKLEENHYALVVKSNENIGDLWNKTVKIKNPQARVLFHYNPKLCPQKIREFVASSEITTANTTNERVDIGITNGDKVPCNQKKLVVKIQKRSNSSVTIVWENFLRNLTDPRHLLNYEVSYKEAPNNVSPYDDRDPCGRDDWKVMDVPKMQYQLTDKEKEPAWEEEKLINNLLYYTRYALYVKTVVIPDENSPNNNTGAESDVLYFVTLPDEPSEPQGLVLTPISSSEVTVTWYPPEKPNGELELYEIYLKPIPEDPNYQDKRNYCTDRRRGDANKPVVEQSTTESLVSRFTGVGAVNPQEECCTCSSSPAKNRAKLIGEVQEESDIENAIVNKVFIENPNYKLADDEANALRKRRRRKRRATGEESSPDSNEIIVFPGDSRVRDDPTGRRPGSDLKLEDRLPVSNSSSTLPLSITLKNLTHYTRYKIGVVACRRKSPDIENDTRTCSQMADDNVQTKPLLKADEINATTVTHNVTGGKLRLHWEEPPHPNGVVLAYEILVKGQDAKDSFPSRCVTRKEFQESKNNYTYNEKIRAGTYSYWIRTVSMAQESDYIIGSFVVTEEGDSVNSATYILLAIVLPIFIILIMGLLLGFYYVRRNEKMKSLVSSANPDYIQNVEIPEQFEVPRDKLELKKELGQGSFGMVYEGVLCDFIPNVSRMKCAVKTVARDAPSEERARFLQEALIMTQMNTHHVVKLLGVISKTQPTFVIMELMLLGDLKVYLRSRRPEESGSKGLPPPTIKEIIRMAAEIADGMAYLDSHSLVHRDLAARNCMVSENVTVKVGDFGMTKDVFETEYYRKATKGLLPVRWMAPESIRDGVFSIKSDCWSYGVVLWEMATLAASPYQGFTNDQVLRYVRDGGVMERPENCPNQLYEMMLRCWQFEARNRPTFAEILDWLVASLEPDFQQISFYHSPKGIEYRTLVQHRPTAEELITQTTPLRATMESDDDEDVDDYDEGQDAHGFPFTYGGDSESGILLQEKACNGTLPRVSYTSGYNSSMNASGGSSGAPTTFNNNRVQNPSQNAPFVSINVGEPRGNNSNGLTQRTGSRPDFLGSLSNDRNNPIPDKLPHSASSGQISGGKVTPVGTNAPQSNSNENSKALSINYSSDGSKYGNGGAPSGGGSGSGTVSPSGPGANTGANGYLLRRSPVTDTYPTNRTTPL